MAESADLRPFPDDLQEWLETNRRAQTLASLALSEPGRITVNPQSGGVTGETAHAYWIGDKSLPLWAGDPFCSHRERQSEDPPGMRMLPVPELAAPGGVSCWKVADDPACHCGVFLNAEYYDPRAERKEPEAAPEAQVDEDDPRLEGLTGLKRHNMVKKIAAEGKQ